MNFDLQRSFEILSRTPTVLEHLLLGVSEFWLRCNEGANTWSPYDIVGHLIHGEKTDWIPRAEIILSTEQKKTFAPFDRFAQHDNDQTRPIQELLEEFSTLRALNLQKLKAFQLEEADLQKTGLHPELGKVTLQELLATWTVHDLGHIAQITRVMAYQYKTEVGPWQAYLGILK